MLDGEGVGAAPEVEPTVEAPTSESSGTDGAAETAGDGEFDWGAWTPEREDVPEQYRPVVTHISTYYQKQLAEAKAAEERAALYQQLYEGQDTGTSAEMIAEMMMARDERDSLKEQFDALNQESSGWTTEKVELAQKLQEAQAEVDELRNKLPEFETQVREGLTQEYTSLLQQDVDAFFDLHAEDLENDAVRDAFAAYNLADVPSTHAIQLAKMQPADQAFAKMLLESGTPANKVLPLVSRAAKERAPEISKAATLTAGSGPVSRSPSPPERDRATGGNSTSSGSSPFARTRALLANT